MNPTTRKMFKSRDARTKLRGMGGILASSPELAQTVQQFQDGGNVDAGFGSNVEYTYRTFLAENNLNDTPQAREMFARYKVYMDTRDPLTDPQLFSSVGFDRAPSALGDSPMTRAVEFDPNRQYSRPDMPPAPDGLSALSVEPDAAFTRQTSPAAPPPSTLDQLRSSVYSTNPLEDALAGTGIDSNVIGTSVIDPIMNRIDQAASREGMPSPTAADIANETALRNREMASENAGRLTAEELMASDPARPGAAPELTADELAMQAYAESLAQQYAPIGEDLQRMDEAVSEFGQRLVAPKVGPEAVTFPGAEGRAIMRGDLTAAEMMPSPPEATAEEFRDAEAALARAQGMPSPGAETPVVDAPEGETPVVTAPEIVTPEVAKKVADPKIQKKAAELAPSPDDTEDDLRTKYEARAKLFREILGEDEAGARNKGMDLAMIGLAIMSGQSPNFLTNIAQGGAAGLQAMSARDEAARERQRLIRTTALESVLDEEAAGTAAAATAAEKERDRANARAVAQIRNSAARTSLYADDDRTYEVAADAARARASDPLFPPDDFLPGDTIESYAKRAGDAAVRLKNESKAAGFGTSGDGPSGSGASIRTQIQKRVDAAKSNPAALAAIKKSLVDRGIDPSTYGIE